MNKQPPITCITNQDIHHTEDVRKLHELLVPLSESDLHMLTVSDHIWVRSTHSLERTHDQYDLVEIVSIIHPNRESMSIKFVRFDAKMHLELIGDTKIFYPDENRTVYTCNDIEVLAEFVSSCTEKMHL